jgi:hypothetical protein
MKGPVRIALIVLCAAAATVSAASRVDLSRRAALEAKSKSFVTANPPGRLTLRLANVKTNALAAFEQEKRAKGVPRQLLMLSPGALQAVVGGPPTPSCATPKISQISAAPPLDPGDEVILNGCGFGAANQGSELRLVGNFPGGYAKFKASVWHDDAIKAVLDPTLKGALDQPDTKLQVVRGDLKLSNQLPIAFRAARDVVLVEWDKTITLACGGDKSDGHFNDCRIPFQGPGLSIPMPSDFTMAGIHWVNDSDLDNQGTDEISLTLKNGYKTCGYGWEWWYQYPGTGFASIPQGYADGRTSLKIRMDWGFTQEGMQFHVDVYAIGPAGIPYH